MRTEQTKTAKSSEKKPCTGLSEQAIEARKAYQRNYYRKNREKVRSWQAGYWARKAATGSETEVTED